jgi:putative ABC transport system permease protein
MMVSVGTMVESFRETVQVWLTSQLGADIYLRADGPATAGVFPPMDSAVPERIKGLPGVAEVDIFHAFPFHYDGSQPTFGAGVMDIVRRRHTLRFMSGNADEILASLPNHDRAIVSEPFADKHNVKVGQVLAIPLGGHIVRLTVAGIYFDYSNDRGFIITDRTTLLRYLPNQPVTNLAVYVQPGADATAVRHSVEDAVQDFPVMVAANRILREGAIRIFDRTFAVTWALEGIAIVVAMLGAANALLALVLDRRREIGLIRYLGGDRRQVRSMILAEAGLLGLLAVVLGLVLGLALSLVLIYVINKQSFGWTIQFHPPVALLAEAVTVIWIFTLLAGAWPARFAAGMEPSGVVQGE